ncbi:hypothetical protein ACFY1J_43050 [Streptomyces sp. NPDC001406]|uniref:hypothetical protein n=1 Tax=Streptomyces sp. NPDC001406 TaxID=3364572 RepID=UPI0036B4A75C
MTGDAGPDTAPDAGPAGPDRTRTAWCPSGAAYAPESLVLGVRAGTDGQVAYLAEPVPAAEVLPLVPPDIEPRRVLRFASHCVAECVNRRGTDCTLIERVVAAYPAADFGPVPQCHLRADCKWWAQAGVSACRRCPAIATRHHTDEKLATLVADPATTPARIDAEITRGE